MRDRSTSKYIPAHLDPEFGLSIVTIIRQLDSKVPRSSELDGRPIESLTTTSNETLPRERNYRNSHSPIGDVVSKKLSFALYWLRYRRKRAELMWKFEQAISTIKEPSLSRLWCLLLRIQVSRSRHPPYLFSSRSFRHFFGPPVIHLVGSLLHHLSQDTIAIFAIL